MKTYNWGILGTGFIARKMADALPFVPQSFLSLLLLGKPKKIKAIAGFGSTDVDFNCSFSFGYDDDSLSVMHSSVVAQTDIVAEIYGEKGTIVFDKWWFTPVPIHLITPDGKKTPVALEFTGNGYNYEAAAMIQCLEQGKKQCEMMSWEDSLLLIDMLDAIRKEIGLVYPDHD